MVRRYDWDIIGDDSNVKRPLRRSASASGATLPKSRQPFQTLFPKAFTGLSAIRAAQGLSTASPYSTSCRLESQQEDPQVALHLS